MRDPKRIPGVLRALENTWKMYPDLRLGQLIENMATLKGGHGKEHNCAFYIEDDDIVAALNQFAADTMKADKKS